MLPGDPNISIEQVVTPYANVDCYAGAQKLLDMYLVPGATVSFRWYLKSHLPFEWLELRIAAGPDGTVTYRIDNPAVNRWERITIGYTDILGRNPRLQGRGRIRMNAVAVIAMLPDGDPAMPFYFGLDDIVIDAARPVAFRFAEPAMHKLSEWKQYIPHDHCQPGDRFTVEGSWPMDADKTTLTVTPFTARDNGTHGEAARYPEKGVGPRFLRHSPGPGAVPRDAPGIQRRRGDRVNRIHRIRESPRHGEPSPPPLVRRREPPRNRRADEQPPLRSAGRKHRLERETLPRGEPDGGHRLRHRPVSTGELAPFAGRMVRPCGCLASGGVYYNTLAYTFFGDSEAGDYARKLLVAVSKFPYWVHPWFIRAGGVTPTIPSVRPGRNSPSATTVSTG